ncbi:MAG: efflux RND transporter permease subunit [Planctomycetaceae bacterium]
MKRFIRWAISNTPAMNTLMVAILAVGVFAGFMLRREEFPRFELDIVLVTVPYPGASPDDVESGICQKIEEAVRSIDGIKKVTSIAREGTANIVIELRSDVPNVQKVLSEIESEIDRIPSLPKLSEKPEIQQLTIRNPAIKLGIVARDNQATDAEVQLREITERVRDDLLMIPEISVANIQGERKYQIDVEFSETTLRKYGLSLEEAARRIGLQNVDLPGGKIRGKSQVFLLRGKHKRIRGSEIEKIPLVTAPNGVVLTVGELGTVRDEFEDTTSISRINGHPGLAISIESGSREDMLAMTKAVREYVNNHTLPPGYSFEIWDDRSIDVEDRLELLKKNGMQGLVLVFIVLALFLDLRLSFWVALGIPISVLGACAVLWQFDETLNMLSMFAFLIALGIVVDDAIVIGENIYSHREQGKGFIQAAIDGTVEVLPSVVVSVTTTIIAFVPMFFVTGVMGKFFAVLPLAVIAMLAISLMESLLILPCHLAHSHPNDNPQSWTQRVRNWRARQRMAITRLLIGPVLLVIAFLVDLLFSPFHRLGVILRFISEKFSRMLNFMIERTYVPVLKFSLRNPGIAIATAVAGLLLSVSLVRNGTVPWIIFPKIDARQIRAVVVYPDGTPSHITSKATEKIERAIIAVNKRFSENGEPVLRLTHRMVGQVTSQSPGGGNETSEGSHTGFVHAELVDNTQRSSTSQEIIDAWRKETGAITGVESLTFESVAMGPGGKAIEFKLLAPTHRMQELEAAVEACKTKLSSYPGVIDIQDDSQPGKWELQLQLKENAKSLGVPLDVVARKARAAYYGHEISRLQRGRHEVKLMVRYPESERRSLAMFQEMRIDMGDGVKRPITELAKINVERGYSEINRIDQLRSITITADVDESRANAAQIVKDLRENFMPGVLAKHPDLRVRWEGQQEQSSESIKSLFVGFALAILAMYVLLTLEFTSYVQPLIIMAVIPFGAVGALCGHALMGLPLTLFSVLGMVALTGVVVNDSIVLVDFINARLKEGIPVQQALLESGQRRFRPVLLTSLTTIAGLLPVLSETSMQAQLLIPMAASLCFGLLFATLLVLVIVPLFYSLYAKWLERHGRQNSAESEAGMLDETPSPHESHPDQIDEQTETPVPPVDQPAAASI